MAFLWDSEMSPIVHFNVSYEIAAAFGVHYISYHILDGIKIV